MHFCISATLILLAFVASGCAFSPGGGRAFYVDPAKGSDDSSGSISEPFMSLDHALDVVSRRVDRGIRSDTVYLRGGVYRKDSDKTLWQLNLHGTPDAYTVLSAMPSEPGAPGAVQRESGRWYENVVFDDGQSITTTWSRVESHPQVWMTKPGFVDLEWTHQNVWPWTTWKSEPFQTTPNDDTPETTKFTVAPYMLLQDGEPFVWVDSVDDIIAPGMRTYDHDTGVLYARPFGDEDPSSVRMETWYGGPEDYEVGTLYLDGGGRALFDGDMMYTEIRGFEFRMFVRLFEFRRRGYLRAEDRGIQRHVRIEDNEFRYGWIHFLLDSNVVLRPDPPGGKFIPRYEDRSDWVVRHNLYYRPSRECFQVHGDNHLFENNRIIDHNGPWAGPAAVVGALNARNMGGFTMRHNIINGQANVAGHRGSIVMMEVEGESHIDEEGDYILGGVTIEGNLFKSVTGSNAIVLGKGDVRMQNITIRSNVFDTNLHDAAIRVSSPNENLVIERNAFLNQKQAIEVYGEGNPMERPPLPSTITIRGNIFLDNGDTIDERLFDAHEGSVIIVDRNLYHESGGPAHGTNAVLASPGLRNPASYDYRLTAGSAAIQDAEDIGPYEFGGEPASGARWWEIREAVPESIPPGSYGLPGHGSAGTQ